MARDTDRMNPLIQIWLPLAIIRKFKTMQGITRLQKFVFLAEAEGHVGDVMGFKAYKYGPYSKRLHNTVRILENTGFLECKKEEMPEGYSDRRDYCLTDEGNEFLSELEEQWVIFKSMQAKLDALSKYENLPTHTLRDYVYGNYLPERVQPDVFGERLRIVLSELESYKGVWEGFEKEHYPISYYVLAILEHSSEILGKIGIEDSSLDNNIIVNSMRYLLRIAWNLLGALEENTEYNQNKDPDVVYFKDELADIFEYIDGKATMMNLAKSFQELTLDDLTPRT